MGNSTSHGNKRHHLGEDAQDTAPYLTADRATPSSLGDEFSYELPSAYTQKEGDYREFVGHMMKEADQELQQELQLLAEDFRNSPDVFVPKQRPRASTLLTPGVEEPKTVVKKSLPTVFKWKGGGKDVQIAGTFNNWKSKIPMVKSNGDFYTIVDLPIGCHTYKFYVDGQWVHDPNEPTSSNNLGGVNNVRTVKQTDFEVFEALAIDMETAGAKKSRPAAGNLAAFQTDDYGQVVPERRPDQKLPGPPILPPHLLQVLLNKDTPAHCEPSLLPEPNHVMLNHLYALSIKDGVMVLSATHRFRKKYVTTLLYKPI